jgi:quinol monooxygenase YgiN
MAGFVQIIQYKTSKFDDMQKIADKFREQTEGRRTVARVMVCKDRDNAGQFMTIAEFPSYEAAMKNNELPETAALAQEMQKLADGPPTFYNLDLERVMED